MNPQIQEIRLIINGAVSIYEGQGLEIPEMLRQQGRGDLLVVLDALTTAMYWIQEILIKE